VAEKFWPGPLTFVLKRGETIPPNVSAGMDTVAVRMPNHAIPLALFRAAVLPVAAPSANRFARPSATTAAHVLEDLDGRVEVILDGGQAHIGLESTIVDLSKEVPVVLRPGGVTLETLRTVIPGVQWVSRHLQPDEPGIEAPGMLLKHYSPRAELLLFAGTFDRVIARMQAEARERAGAEQLVGVLAPDEEAGYFADIRVVVCRLGSRDDLKQIGANLFKGLRSLDAQGVDVILARTVEPAGLGVAIADRLLRAAEGRVIEC
jgi:L-threonylcarbamoyladenylate synthase